MAKKVPLKINVVVNAVYQILTLLVPLITTPFVSRVLGPAAIGQYSLYFSIVSYFCLISTFGFNEFGTKAISENRDNPEQKTIIFFSILLSKLVLGTLVLGGFLLFVFLSSSDFNTLVCYLCLGLYILATIIDYTFYFQGEERFIGICVRNTLMRIFTLILIFVLIKSSDDLWIYCIILGLGQFLATLSMVFSFKKSSFVKIKIKDLSAFNYIKLAFPYFIPALSVSLFSYLNQVLLGAMGASDAENGFYGQAMKIIQVLSTLAGSISIIMFSRVSYLLKTNNFEEVKTKIDQTFSAFWILAFPLLFGLYAVSDVFVPLFLGPGYDRVIILTYILAPQIIFSPLNGLYGNLYFRPNNKIWIQTIIIFGASVINIILAVILIPNYESVGTSISKLVAEFIQLPFLVFLSRKFITLKSAFKTSIKPLISSSIMFICVFVTNLYLVEYISNEILFLLLLICEGAIIYLLMEIIMKDKLVIGTIAQVYRFVFKRRSV